MPGAAVGRNDATMDELSSRTPNRRVATPSPSYDRHRLLMLTLYSVPVLLTCAWVLSLPVFPSQDGPLHLYYVNAFRQLLTHKGGIYTDAYTIKAYITPYSSYYYGLIALGKAVPLETADKIMVCLYLILFAVSTRVFIRSVTPRAEWAPFLVLPVLLNWPLMMGFINYSLSTCLACFAFAVWCRGSGRIDLKYRITFLLLIALMMVTHPVPWLFVTGFAFFDLAMRLTRSRVQGGSTVGGALSKTFRLDLITALLACVPYPYLRHFNGMVQTTEPERIAPMPFQASIPPLILPYAQRAQGFIRTFGLDIYAGSGASARLYRFGISFLVLAVITMACIGFVRQRKSGEWSASSTWFLFSACVFPFLLFLPDAIGNHFYFISRLGILFFLCCLAGASLGLQRMRHAGIALAAFSIIWWALTLGMAVRYIAPPARDIVTLRQVPLPGNRRPGLLMRTIGSTSTPNLNFLPYYWAGATYFRQRDLLLYNTAWLGDPIIPVAPREDHRNDLDASYYEGLPYFGSVMLPSESAALDTLHKAGFVFLMRQGADPAENPLADHPSGTMPGNFASGWICQHGQGDAWYLCELPASARLAFNTPR